MQRRRPAGASWPLCARWAPASVVAARLSCGVRQMTQDDARSEYAVIAELGKKIGIPELAMQDFDLIFAKAHSLDKFCDQFESIEFARMERFHFMQLIVASLDLALRDNVPGVETCEKRVEKLLLKDVAAYKYIIDYWGRCDSELHTVPMMQRLKGDSRYMYMGGDAMFEDPPKL